VLLAADGPRSIPPHSLWPLHESVKNLLQEAGRRGLEHHLPALALTPSSEVGVRADGVDDAWLQLRAEGVLRVVEDDAGVTTVPDTRALRRYRRMLLAADPRVCQLLYRAGRNWAALSAISPKTASSARTSSGSVVRAATPN
jgi:hypothetical protein